MNERITASWGQLMSDASNTADEYLHKAVRSIDHVLGKGYAKDHPELIGQYMLTCAVDLHGATLGRVLQDGLTEVRSGLEEIATNLDGLVKED